MPQVFRVEMGLNFRRRIEDHIVRVHLFLDELPYFGKPCVSRCLISHVSSYFKHVPLAAKKITDHVLYLVEKVQVAMIRKMCNQKEIPTLKTEVGKTKLTIRY